MQKTNGIQLYKRLLLDVKVFWFLLFISVLGSIVYAASDASAIYLMRPIINKGIELKDVEFLKTAAILIFVLFFFRGVASFVSSFFMGKLGANIVLKFRNDLYNKFLTLPSSYYDKSTTGSLLSKLLYNISQITQAASKAIQVVAQDGAFVIGLIINMLIISWKMTLFILFIAPFLGLFIAWVSKRFRRLSYKAQTAMGNLTHTAEESLRGYKEIRMFGGEELHSDLFEKDSKEAYKQEVKTILTDALSSPVIQILGGIILCTLIYSAAIAGTDSESWMNSGDFVAFFSSMLAILKPIKNLTNVNSTIQKALAATDDLYQILDNHDEFNDGKTIKKKIVGDIEFKNISFSYDANDKEIIKNVSFKVNQGKTIALVGSSGSGKSTLISLLTRFYNVSKGEITLDNDNIQDYDLKNLRSHISLVTQHVMLFNDTILHNITYGSKNPSKKDIDDAIENANAKEFIDNLPNGLLTNVGENGFSLSGGQRQRIAIARAILKKSQILILDEATSSLDNKSESLVKDALNKLMKNRTTIIIAHRLSSIEDADHILVFDDGQIIESGYHNELLNKNGMYANLYKNNYSENVKHVVS